MKTRISISLPQHERDYISLQAHKVRMSKSEFVLICIKYYRDTFRKRK